MSDNNNAYGIKIMQDEGYDRPVESETKLQKTEHAWWSTPGFIIFLTISMSVLDAMVLYDIMDQAMTQSEFMGKLVSFGIALVLNMLPLLIAKFTHQAMYRIKRGAAIWAVTATLAFFLLFASTVVLRFAYQDQYGESSSNHITNELQVENTVDDTTQHDTKGFAVVLLLSIEPLVTSLVNFCLAYISDDEVRARLNHLRKRRLELVECESDLNAYLATTESAELRREKLLLIDQEKKKAAQDEVKAFCDVLKARARFYLAEYLKDPAAASYVNCSWKEGTEGSGEEVCAENQETDTVNLPHPESFPENDGSDDFEWIGEEAAARDSDLDSLGLSDEEAAARDSNPDAFGLSDEETSAWDSAS